MSEIAAAHDFKRPAPAVALSPAYPMVDFGTDVEIFSGQFVVEGHRYEGRMWSPPLDQLRLRCELESASIGLEIESFAIDLACGVV